MRSRTITFLLVCACSMWSACAYGKSYTFGVASEAGTATKAYEDFVKALSERLHQPVTLEVLAMPGEEQVALELGKIDIALIKAIPYGRAKSENRKVAGLVTVVSQNGNEEEVTHSGYIVALQASHIDDLAGLKGKRFGFVRGSASGSIYPVAYLEQEGIDYRSYFSEHRCYPSHDRLIEALNAGEIDGGTTFRPPNLPRNKDIGNLKVIARVPNIPNPLIAVSADLSEAEKAKLKEALIDFRTARSKA
jgi:ABC-type phosphate/phosphonate transport system substrate-binding protein